MAIYYGVNADKLLVDVPAQLVDGGQAGGRVYVIKDKFTLTADLAGSGVDTIRMGSLIPKGATVLEALMKVADLDGSGGTLDFGWEASADGAEVADENGFLEAVDVATAADCFYSSQNQASPAGVMKTFAASVQPVIKVEGDTDATAGDIEVWITYTI